MNNNATSTGRVTLRLFGRDDFARLISWLPTEADLIECAAFFQYPLTEWHEVQRGLAHARVGWSRWNGCTHDWLVNRD
jgi:hypothetical protein